MEKHAQFYLVATVIIVAIVAGVTFVANYSFEKTPSKFYPVEEELQIESARVVDYGIYQKKNMQDLLKNFSRDYALNSDSDSSYFIFGKEDNLTLAGHNKVSSEVVLINVGLGEQQITFNQNQFQTFNFSNTGQNVKLIVNGISYDFPINKGNNFYFVVSKNIDNERYVATNGD